MALELGKVYKLKEGCGHFPFTSPYGLFLGYTKAAWPRFIWNGKDSILNATAENFQEVKFKIIVED